jgi:hypothetical protein
MIVAVAGTDNATRAVKATNNALRPGGYEAPAAFKVAVAFR